MIKIQKLLDRFTYILSDILVYILLLMISLVFISIVLRYLFNISYVSIQEMIIYLHASIFMFGISYALKEDAHVKIDIIINQLDSNLKFIINIIGLIFFLLPTSIFIIFISSDMVSQSWRILEGSSEAGGMNAVFILKSFIPIMGLLVLIQTISKLIKTIQGYNNGS